MKCSAASLWGNDEGGLFVTNAEVAAVFKEMGELLDIRGGDGHRARAFLRTANIIESLREPLSEMLRFGRLEKIRGIGEGSMVRIKSILRTGTCADRDKLLRELPSGLRDLLKVRGLGPRTVRRIYAHLRISSVPALYQAAKSGALLNVPGISLKVAQSVLLESERLLSGQKRVTLAQAIDVGQAIVAQLRLLPEVLRVEQTGSARRRKESIKDLDFLVASLEPKKVAEGFAQLPDTVQILLAGDSRVSTLLANGLQADLRIVPPDSFGAGMHYFTGSKAHNIRLRTMANQRGLVISEHGVFQKKPGRRKPGISSRIEELRYLSGAREADLFQTVGLPFIPPELREDDGEFEAAQRGRLPVLVESKDLVGLFCVSTSISEGSASPEVMLNLARSQGRSYVVFTEDAGAFFSAKKTRQYLEECRGERKGVRSFAGLKTRVRFPLAFDASKKLLSECDFVAAVIDDSVAEKDRAACVEAAMASGVVDVFLRATGRRGRDEVSEHWTQTLLKLASKYKVALGFSVLGDLVDVSPRVARMAKERGVPLVLTSEAHCVQDIEREKYGIMFARRAWMSAGHLLNTQVAAATFGWRAQRRERLGQDEAAPNASDSILVSALLLGALEATLKERLLLFLREGADEQLRAALMHEEVRKVAGSASENPVQVAFALLQRPSD